MLNKLNIAGYVIAIGVIAYLLINPKTEYIPVDYKEDYSMRDTTEVDTVVKTDTVTVRDTVLVELDIPDPIEEDGVKVYTTDYSDKFIIGEIESGVKGTLEYQYFEYIRKIKQIEKNTISTIQVNRYLKQERVFEDPNYLRPRGLWGGLDVDIINQEVSLTPNIQYIRGNISYKVGYNIEKKYPRVGVNFKIF